MGWLRRLDIEHDNLRSALRWTIEHNDTQPGLRLGAALWRFWFNRGHFAEARRWLEQLLTLVGSDTPSRASALVLFGAATLAVEQTDFAAALDCAQRTLEVSRLGVGTRASSPMPGCCAANVERGRGDYVTARQCYEEALKLHHSRADDEQVSQDIAITLGTLGHVALAEGDSRQAHTYYQDALVIERDHGQRKQMANLLYRLGEVALEEGGYSEARAHFEERGIRRDGLRRVETG